MYGACYWCQLWRKGPEAKSVCVEALNKFTFGSGLQSRTAGPYAFNKISGS